MLGVREPEIYGHTTYRELEEKILRWGQEAGFETEVYQSNHEGDLVDRIQAAYGNTDGIVINPAAYTHTSVALLDALKTVAIPAVEIHISDVKKREAFRQVSYVRQACIGTVMGEGIEGYRTAIELLKNALNG